MLLTFGLWLTGLRQRTMKPAARLPAAVAAVLAIGLGVSHITGDAAQPSSPVGKIALNQVKLAELRKGDKPIFLYFTADWCMICKVNEQVAIDRRTTTNAFTEAGVQMMRGDWANGSAEITTFLEQHGRSGVPLYLWYSTGQSEPLQLPQILGPDTLKERVQP